MEMNKSDINLSGIYLVVDPTMDQSVLLDKVEQALEGGVGILQIWNRWPVGMQESDKEQLITYILGMAGDYGVPVLVNEAWELLKTTYLDGVHFDAVPDDLDSIKEEIGRDFITGITCGNDLEVIEWAEEQGVDYASFCAMFPSPSVGSCEIVHPETIHDARQITKIPLFLSGGITPEKINHELAGLDFQGVAVISGILKDEEPKRRVFAYKKALENHMVT
jgi:thiamine-phosphate pyrophosphorylase